ncbi:hypothetical protein ACFPYJ_16655 [Paenibacillus solisilvae]|uniref:Uncharacterized protein n=1 Tax=Paenibacillus solisilvae TaxID=2486751 RepID=A0ABW0W2W5_9BACL
MVQESKENSRVLIIGESYSGRAKLINALLGQELLAVDDRPAADTGMIIKYGTAVRIYGYFQDGTRTEMDAGEVFSLEKSGKTADSHHRLDHLEIQHPAELLKKITLMNSPGRTLPFGGQIKAAAEMLKLADDVIWLFNSGTADQGMDVDALYEIQDHYGISPLGLINSIHAHEDHSGAELDKVSSSKRSRLWPYVRELIWISVDQALQGKLDNDPDRIHRSNIAEIEAALSSQEKLKTKRTMKQVIAFMEGFIKPFIMLLTQRNVHRHHAELERFLREETGLLTEQRDRLPENKASLQEQSLSRKPHSQKPASLDELIQLDTYAGLKQIAEEFTILQEEHEGNIQTCNNNKLAMLDLYKQVSSPIKRLFAPHQTLLKLRTQVEQVNDNQRSCSLTASQISRLKEDWKELHQQAERKKQTAASPILNTLARFRDAAKTLQQFSFIEELRALLGNFLNESQFREHDTGEDYLYGRMAAQFIVMLDFTERLSFGEIIHAFQETEKQLSAAAAGAVRTELPHRLNGQVPQTSEIMNYIPIIPEPVRIDTTSYRSYTIACLLMAALIIAVLFLPSSYRSLDFLHPGSQNEELKSPDSNETAPASAANVIGYIKVLTGTLNVRCAPDSKADIVTIIRPRQRFPAYEKSGKWLRIGTDKWITFNTKLIEYYPSFA